MNALPEVYTEKMKDLLGSEYDAYMASLQEPSACGLRVNTSKIDVNDFKELIPFDLDPVPWCPNGFYYQSSEKPALHPLYHCGLFYIQEPSAMAPASFLPVEKGDRILDLCAAPGGKTTQLALGVQDEGLLVSNDISPSRTKALVKNIELFGLKNTIVTCESPARLAEVFPSYFDKILVDAPCSGEGMFRKGNRMIEAWKEHGPAFFAPIQKEIVTEAVRMLKPGGLMLYSTCTFDPSEDEQMIEYIINLFPEMKVQPLPEFDGMVPGFTRYVREGFNEIRHTRRLFPHRIRGDGHFVALLRKAQADQLEMSLSAVSDSSPRVIEQTFGKGKAASVMRFEIPSLLKELPDIRYKRNGLLIGQVKAGRLHPSQAYAMTLRKGEFTPELNLSVQDERVMRYLKGESLIVLEEDQLPAKGDVLVLIEGYPAGWGTINGNKIKNNLLPGWRAFN